jgi:tetratricopeptide (TPR) repeat protein
VGAGNRPSQLPSNSRPGQGAGSRPGGGNNVGNRPSQLPAGGNRVGAGNRPGTGNRPSQLPGLGAGIAAGGNIGRRDSRPSAESREARHDQLQDRMQGRDENRGARQEGRQENRGDRQEDRQQWRNENREDWQNWADDHHGDHGDWYHDGWHGYGDGSWWNHMWSDHTAFMALGTTMWGLNRLAYWSGYGGYSNPYYDSGAGYGYDYSQSYAAPTDMAYTTADTQTTAAPADTPSPGLQSFDQARTAFYENRYDDAMKATDKALASMPKDAVIHEFRALILFAQGKYREAAAALHPVLAVGPGWDWTTMAGLYPSVDVYTKQLRKLEDYVRAHPDAADARFLLAYHYLTGNHKDAAIGQLKTVIKLQPEDTVSAQLLATFGADVPDQEPAQKNPAPGIEESKLYGTWKATREGGSEFQLTLTKDHAFTWVYTKGKTRQEMKGVYAFQGDELALEPDAGGLMGADISNVEASGFNFRMVGAPASDKGLDFRRSS